MAKSKTAVAAVALGVVGALAVGYVGASVWRNSWNPSKWVKPGVEISRPADETPETPNDNKSWGKVISADGEVLETGKTYAMPAIMFMSNIDESEISTTSLEAPEVFITAENNIPLLNLSYDWEAKYADGTSASEAVQITPASDDGLTVKVKCLNAFSNQINLSVHANENPGIAVSTTIDYVKRIQNAYDFDFGGTIADLDGDNVMQFKTNFSEGTTAGVVAIDNITITTKPEFFNNMFLPKLSAACAVTSIGYVHTNYDTSTNDNINYTAIDPGYGVDVISWSYTWIIGNMNTAPTGYTKQDKVNAVKYAWNAAMKEWQASHGSESNLQVSYTLSLKYNGSVIQTVSNDNANSLTTFYGVPDDEVPTPHLTLNNSITY